jgi:hypothetical protein
MDPGIDPPLAFFDFNMIMWSALSMEPHQYLYLLLLLRTPPLYVLLLLRIAM